MTISNGLLHSEDLFAPSDVDDMLDSWSHSRLVTFEKCRLMAKLKYVDKIPEPERPLPPGKTEQANDRGSRIHDAAERFVQGGIELIPELASRKDKFDSLKASFTAGKVALEGEWAIDREWNSVPWRANNVWGRMKLDAKEDVSPTEMKIIDYKTGRKFGNELKHAEQGQIYTLSTFMRYPKVETVRVEFWYTDQQEDQDTEVHFNKTQALKFLKPLNKRAAALTDCSDFKPNPNVFSCRWCPYGPKGTGHCKVGIQ